MRSIPRLLAAALVAPAAIAAAPAAASAGIWAPAASGTTDAITAIDYQDDASFWFATSGGKVFKRVGGTFVQQTAQSAAFNDLAVLGSKAIAVGDSAKVFFFNGTSWAPGSVANATWDISSCASTPQLPNAPAITPTGNFLSVKWAGTDHAYLTSSDHASVLETPDGGATWHEVNRQQNGTCRANGDFTDSYWDPNDPTRGYLIDQSFGELFATATAFTGPIPRRAELVNCFNQRPRFAVDPGNFQRIWAADRCSGSTTLSFSGDGGTSYQYVKIANGTVSELGGENDVDVAAGAFLAVGRQGTIATSVDGVNAFLQPADGALATTEWTAGDIAADGRSAAVGGSGGALVTTVAVNSVPDLKPPTGLIAGPSTAAAQAPVTFTAQVADETGGSGINTAALNWTTPGLPNQTGATATFTFPTAGTYTVTLAFGDNAGNAATATKSITIGKSALPKPTLAGTSKPPVTGNGATRRGKFVILKVRGRLGRPTGVSRSAACKGTMSLSVYKGKKRIFARTTKVNSKCGYAKTLKVKRTKVGSASRLKLKVAFKGNAALAPLSSTYKVKVKKQ